MGKSKLAFMFLLISIVTAIYFTYEVIINKTLLFDEIFTAFFLKVFPEQTQSVFKIITFFASKIGIGLVGISLILWLWLKKKNYPGIVLVLVTVALGNELNDIMKNTIKRPRPELKHLVEVSSFSFPSAHAMVGMILYIVVGYFIVKELKTASAKWIVGLILGLLVFLIGVSRIVLHVHFPSDVFGGFAWGYIWVYLMINIHERYIGRRSL
jgi:undecaprenyl-diphosphatase